MGQSQSAHHEQETKEKEEDVDGLPVHQPVASTASGNVHVFDPSHTNVAFVPKPGYSAYDVTFSNEEKMKNVVVAVATRKKE